jgi:hypothetical protein
MSQGNRAGDAVTVKVNLTDTSSVFGVAFDVAFDDTKVAYTGLREGHRPREQRQHAELHGGRLGAARPDRRRRLPCGKHHDPPCPARRP